MEELNHQLQLMPQFLQSEVHSRVGSLQGLSPSRVVNRYRVLAQEIALTKRTSLRQDHIDNANFFRGRTISTKKDVENMNTLRELPGPRATDFYSLSMDADFVMQCVGFLTTFGNNLGQIQSRLEDAERRQAQEAGLQAAKRQAEEATRELAQRQAEEAARLTAERVRAESIAVDQRRKEAAMQLAQRQVEAAGAALAQRRAEEEALRSSTLPPASTGVVQLIRGPEGLPMIEIAVVNLKHAIDQAIEEFVEAVELHFDGDNLQHWNALQHAAA
jgi:hypothetical protein